MQTTVSRRFVFIKQKRRRTAPRPKLPLRVDERMVGESTAKAPVFAARPLVVPENPAARWIKMAAWAAGLAGVVGIVFILVGLAKPPQDSGAQVQAARSGFSSPGYARAGGRSQSVASYAASVSPPASSAQGFLSSPFPNRKPVTCSVQVDGSKEAIQAFGKCLEQANEKAPPPAR